MKIIFCGTIEREKSRSWGITNKLLLDKLKTKHDDIQHVDYNLNNKIILRSHHIIAKLLYGEIPVRDKFINNILEIKFVNSLKKLGLTGNTSFLHSGTLSIPSSLLAENRHFLYTDATPAVNHYSKTIKTYEKIIRIYNKHTNKYLNRLEKIFTFNQWTLDSYKSEFNFPEHKLLNVGFGANLDPYNGTKDYRNNLILIVLRKGLEEIKGLNLLLKAFKIAKSKNTNLRLAVVGTTLEHMDGVEYYEDFPRSKTIELFQEASLYAMPALMESNGMVYPEALSCKTPILGLDRLAFPEFSGYGKYGFIVKNPDHEEIANKIVEAMSDPDKLEKMGTDGQKFAVDRYNWDKVTDRILEQIRNDVQ